jgi:hypothetical protein
MNSSGFFSKMSAADQTKITIVILLFIACLVYLFFFFNQLSGFMQIVYILIVLFLFSYIIYIYFSIYLTPTQYIQVGPDTIPLNKVSQAAPSEILNSVWSSKSGATLIFYINPIINDRTAQSGNEYATIVNIGAKQKLKVLVAPDAGRGLSLAPAIFEIYTKNNNKPEVMEIPDFPMQRWTAVVIVKKGRRFNIYMNGKLAVSHTCTAMPDFDETTGLSVGDQRLGGTMMLINLAPIALETNHIRDLMSETIDTSGKPYMPLDLSSLFSFPLPSLPSDFWCPGGNCNTPKMAGPLEEWVSPYA